MIEHAVLADSAGFANDDACAMVDSEVFTNGCTGMDINSRTAVRYFSHHTWHQGHIELVEAIG